MWRFGSRGRRKSIPIEPALLAAAAENPGGSVAEIDPAYIDDPNGYVPPEAIRGAWLVDSSGKLTGEYQDNLRHGVPQDDFSKLTDPDHWLGRLGDDPAAAVREGSDRGSREKPSREPLPPRWGTNEMLRASQPLLAAQSWWSMSLSIACSVASPSGVPSPLTATTAVRCPSGVEPSRVV